MTFDEMLKQAFDETADERAAQMLVVEEKHRFSLAYRLWERKKLRDLRRNRYDRHWTLRKARHIVTAIIIASSLLLGVTAYAAIAAIGRYSFDNKPDYSKLLIENHPSDKTTLEEYYGLPEDEGWEIIDFYADENETMINYICNEKKVTFSQEVIHRNMGNINTKNVIVEPISIYKENDGFIIDYGERGCLLYWIYDSYLLHISSNLNKNETINLALSTKSVDLKKFF